MNPWIWPLAILALIIYALVHFKRTRSYFAKYGIPQPAELPILGTFGSTFLGGLHINEFVKRLYFTNKSAKYIGCHMISKPLIIVLDPELVKNVLVKNFDHFAHRVPLITDTADPLFGKNLAALNGDKWREIRNLLSPAFTSSKMRSMHILISRCARNFVDGLLERYADADAVDVKDVFTRYANDVIATCAFGIEVDSLKNPKNEFYVYGLESSFSNLSAFFKFMVIRFCPLLARMIGFKVISKQATDFFVNVIETTIKTRDEQGITRSNMLQLLMDARGKTSDNLDLNTLEITAQAFIFFLAGFETSSGVTSLIAHELAVNPDAQERLQADIDALMARHHGNPRYEAISDMPYLDAIFSETMRMHAIPTISRICSKAFQLPPALSDSLPYTVPAGAEIWIPIPGIHNDPDYYEEPDKFKPERYLDRKGIPTDTTNLGFGLGPRMCIENRFAILETKLLFVHLLAKCNLVPCKKTCIPMRAEKLILFLKLET